MSTLSHVLTALAAASADAAGKLEALELPDGAPQLQLLDEAAQTFRCVAEALERVATQPGLEAGVDAEALGRGLPLEAVRARIVGAEHAHAPAGELDLF